MPTCQRWQCSTRPRRSQAVLRLVAALVPAMVAEISAGSDDAAEQLLHNRQLAFAEAREWDQRFGAPTAAADPGASAATELIGEEDEAALDAREARLLAIIEERRQRGRNEQPEGVDDTAESREMVPSEEPPTSLAIEPGSVSDAVPVTPTQTSTSSLPVEAAPIATDIIASVPSDSLPAAAGPIESGADQQGQSVIIEVGTDPDGVSMMEQNPVPPASPASGLDPVEEVMATGTHEEKVATLEAVIRAQLEASGTAQRPSSPESATTATQSSLETGLASPASEPESTEAELIAEIEEGKRRLERESQRREEQPVTGQGGRKSAVDSDVVAIPGEDETAAVDGSPGAPGSSPQDAEEQASTAEKRAELEAAIREQIEAAGKAAQGGGSVPVEPNGVPADLPSDPAGEILENILKF